MESSSAQYKLDAANADQKKFTDLYLKSSNKAMRTFYQGQIDHAAGTAAGCQAEIACLRAQHAMPQMDAGLAVGPLLSHARTC